MGLPMKTIALFLCLLLAACTVQPNQTINTASAHYTDVSGRLIIEKNAAGGEFGVCHFADNRQCGEWALMRGHYLVVVCASLVTAPRQHVIAVLPAATIK